MSAIDALSKTRDTLDEIGTMYPNEAELESQVANLRQQAKVIQNQIQHSLDSRAWISQDAGTLKLPGGEDCFVSWQRAMAGLKTLLDSAVTFTIRANEIHPDPFVPIPGLPADQEKQRQDEYEAYLQRVQAENESRRKDVETLKAKYDETYAKPIVDTCRTGLKGIKDTVVGTVASAHQLGQHALDSVQGDAAKHGQVQRLFDIAVTRENEMRNRIDATTANIGETAWAQFMRCVQTTRMQ